MDKSKDTTPTPRELGYEGNEDFSPKEPDTDAGEPTPDTHKSSDPGVETYVEDK